MNLFLYSKYKHISVNRKSILYCLIIVFTFINYIGLAQPDQSFISWYGEQIEETKTATYFTDNLNSATSSFNLESLNQDFTSEFFLKSEYTDSYYKILCNYNQQSLFSVLAKWFSYKDTYESLCEKHSIPLELAVLPLALSAMNIKAVNDDGNTGLWQLHYLIAVKYGLRIESFYDERIDPVLSAEIAFKHLKNLYQITGNWTMAIISYTTGMPEFRKAKDQCNCNNPDSLLLFIPQKHQYTYPMFMAWLQITDYYKDYTDILPQVSANPISETVEITDRVHIEQIQGLIGITLNQIREYNPLITDAVIDGRKESVPFNLPPEITEKYNLLKDSIPKFLDTIYFPKPQSVEITYTETGGIAYNPGSNYERIDYIICSGDNLGAIANRFDVNISELRDWNALNGNTIYAGKKLFIYKPVEEASKYRNISQNEVKKNEKSPIPEGSIEIVYEVKSGDSPYTIAKNFDGVSDKDIMSWNNISNPSKLQLGQKLKIYITE